MRRRLLLSACCAATIFAPRVAFAERVLIVTDPTTPNKSVTLVEFAVADALRGHAQLTVRRPAEASPKRARAQRMAKDGDTLRRNGQRQFEQLELDAALKFYTKAVRKLEKAMPLVEDQRPLREALKMQAATLLLVGQERKARAAIERLLVIDVDVEPGAVFNPQMMSVFDGVRSQFIGSSAFDVDIDVDPPGAAVFFDGRLAGLSPVSIKGVRRGRHYVSAVKPGYDLVGKAVEFKPRSSHAVSLKLPTSRRGSRTEVAAAAAVAAIDDEVMSPEAQDLVDKFRANSIILLAVDSDVIRLVRYNADGSTRYSKESQELPTDAAAARTLATTLLGPFSKPTEPEDGASGGDGDSGDGGDDGFTDDFGDDDGGKPEDKLVAASSWDKTGSSSSQQSGGGGFHLFSEDPTKERVLYGAFGGGIVLAAVGGVFGYLALASEQEYYRETKLQGGRIDHDGTTDQVEGESVASGGKRNALIADVMYGVAGAAILTGLILQFAWNPKPPQPPPSASTGDGDTPPKDKPADSGGSSWNLLVGPGFLRVDF